MPDVSSAQHMAPEQTKNLPGGYGTPVDILALGAVVFCMRSGRLPFTNLHQSFLLYIIRTLRANTVTVQVMDF